MAQILAVGMDAINPNLALPLTRDKGQTLQRPCLTQAI